MASAFSPAFKRISFRSNRLDLLSPRELLRPSLPLSNWHSFAPALQLPAPQRPKAHVELRLQADFKMDRGGGGRASSQGPSSRRSFDCSGNCCFSFFFSHSKQARSSEVVSNRHPVLALGADSRRQARRIIDVPDLSRRSGRGLSPLLPLAAGRPVRGMPWQRQPSRRRRRRCLENHQLSSPIVESGKRCLSELPRTGPESTKLDRWPPFLEWRPLHRLPPGPFAQRPTQRCESAVLRYRYPRTTL